MLFQTAGAVSLFDFVHLMGLVSQASSYAMVPPYFVWFSSKADDRGIVVCHIYHDRDYLSGVPIYVLFSFICSVCLDCIWVTAIEGGFFVQLTYINSRIMAYS